MKVRSIYRYPVKGLSPESLARTVVAPLDVLPSDRRFALARAETRFDPDRPEWLPKSSFLMLARDERLATLATAYDESAGILTIGSSGSTILAASIGSDEGRRRIEGFFADFLSDSISAPPRLVEAPGHAFTDASRKPKTQSYKYVSLLNLESIAMLERTTRARIDPLRFRANIYFDGLPAWQELGWVGQELVLGGARLRVVSPTVRCAATTVNPATGERDLDVPRALKDGFGHVHMGVYAEVLSAGEFGEGASMVLAT